MTAILSVVRGLYVDPKDAPYEMSPFAKRLTMNEQYLRDSWTLKITHHNNVRAGKYIKSGGRDATDNLQEAQIFGWSRKAKENLKGYTAPFYEVLPIRVEIA